MSGWNMNAMNLCECGHEEKSHGDPDFDFNGEGYVECRRQCLVKGCDCVRFWEFRPGAITPEDMEWARLQLAKIDTENVEASRQHDALRRDTKSPSENS